MILKKSFIFCSIRNCSTSLLNFNATELQNFIALNKLKNINITLLQKTEKLLKESGYTDADMIKHASVFKHHFHILDQRLAALKEGGFQYIPLTMISKFRNVINKDVKALKELGHIPNETVVAELLLKKLDPPVDRLNINDLLNDSLTFSKIHKTIITRYLVDRLESNDNQITSLFRLHQRLNLKPLSYFCWNINFALEIGYSNEKILKNMYLLCANPKVTREIIKEVPMFIPDVDIKNEMFIYPKIIGLPLDQFQTIYNTLKKHGIKDGAFKRSMNIFTLSPKTIEKRLQEIQKQPEMRVMLYEPSILKLIVHYNRAKDRLNILHEYKMKCSTLRILGTDGDYFDDHVKDGKDKTYNQDVYRFIKRLLKCNVADIKEKLRRHPYFNYVPLTSIQDSYFYLKALKFTEDELQEVVQLLLYPRYKIRDGYNQCKAYCIRNELNIHNVQILNLTLYFIEKEHHFTGNGIWENIEENL